MKPLYDKVLPFLLLKLSALSGLHFPPRKNCGQTKQRATTQNNVQTHRKYPKHLSPHPL